MLRQIRLSGYAPAAMAGRIVVEDTILTTAAFACTAGGVLCWADVRLLDDAFRATLAGDANGLAYIQGTKYDAGRQLFSLLTGRKIVRGPAETAFPITGGAKAERMLVAGGMSFPNHVGAAALSTEQRFCDLAGFLVDSDYGKFCKPRFDAHVQLNGPAAGTVYPSGMGFNGTRFFARYQGQLNANTTLCPQDRADIWAFIMLYAWSRYSWCAGLMATALTGTFTMTLPLVVPSLPKDFAKVATQTARDWARSMYPGFAAGFGISPSYGAAGFPFTP